MLGIGVVFWPLPQPMSGFTSVVVDPYCGSVMCACCGVWHVVCLCSWAVLRCGRVLGMFVSSVCLICWPPLARVWGGSGTVGLTACARNYLHWVVLRMTLFFLLVSRTFPWKCIDPFGRDTCLCTLIGRVSICLPGFKRIGYITSTGL